VTLGCRLAQSSGDRHNSTGSFFVMSVLVSSQSRVPGLAFSLRMGLLVAGVAKAPSTPTVRASPAAQFL